MATFRDDPYGRFNFLVDLGSGEPGSVDAGFEEVAGIAGEIEVVEYRNGNDRLNTRRKLPGLHTVHDVTLKRGVIGTTTLFDWIQTAIDGHVERRDVSIRLLSEDRAEVALTWRLSRAFPVKYVAGPLDATATDVAIEELVLTCEGLRVE